jgi:hypothetical protein
MWFPHYDRFQPQFLNITGNDYTVPFREIATKFIYRFEDFTAVTMKNAVFWDVRPCGSCKDRNVAPPSSG